MMTWPKLSQFILTGPKKIAKAKNIKTKIEVIIVKTVRNWTSHINIPLSSITYHYHQYKMVKTKKNKHSLAKSLKAMIQKKKFRPTLVPPTPSTENQADTVPRLHLAVSASNYGIAFATKGPPNSPDKAYTVPAEKKMCDPTDLKFNKLLNCYGLAKLRKAGSSNLARQHYWTTTNAEKRGCDWKVRQ